MQGSLLPKYRGACDQRAIINGETQTGASLHEMVENRTPGAWSISSPCRSCPTTPRAKCFDKVTVAARSCAPDVAPLLAGVAKHKTWT